MLLYLQAPLELLPFRETSFRCSTLELPLVLKLRKGLPRNITSLYAISLLPGPVEISRVSRACVCEDDAASRGLLSRRYGTCRST